VPQWNRYGDEGSITEIVHFCELAADAAGRTQVLLHNAAGNHGVGIHFNKQHLPCFSLWKNLQPAADGYVTGLEPGINFPNPRSFEKQKGRVAMLAPGASRTFEVTIEALGDAAAVAAAKSAITAIQGDVTPEILSAPNPDWSVV
jgi:hypothetical protein